MKTSIALLFCTLVLGGACRERREQVAPAGTTLAPMPRESPQNKSVDTRGIADHVNSNYEVTADNAPLDGSDLALTARIRQAVMGDGHLSMAAQNVKIIVRDGRVTLRGPVHSLAERSRVHSIVAAIAGDHRVDNQLEIDF